MTTDPTTREEASERTLLPRHRALLERRAIAPEVIAARGYFSAAERRDLTELGFQGAQGQLAPALVIPVSNVRGEVALHQVRPDQPRQKRGKLVKYETKGGARMVVDVPSGAREKLANPAVPLFITEGAMKADAAVSAGLCCVAILGVWNWRGTNELGGTLALSCWESIPLNDRIVFLTFDSDVMVKREVAQALSRLGSFLKGRGAQVHYVYLPPASDGSKQGLDDYLAAGHSIEELINCSTIELRGLARQRTDASASAPPYHVVGGQIVLEKHTKDGEVDVPLCSFDARIVNEEIRDDGVESSMHYRVEGLLPSGQRLPHIDVPAERFGSMRWVSEWGNRAVVFAGSGACDHLRAGIQLLSGDVPRTTTYTHLGWRRINDAWVYLHVGGAIGAEGPVEGVAVLPPGPLACYALPSPPNGEALRQAVRASLELLEVARDTVSVLVLCAVYRSMIDAADFSIHLAGFTGVYKTELAALAQQHFGAKMNSRQLPGSWSSTGNSLEILAFHAKDALLVVDDYAPSGSQADVARMQRDAERLLRAQGNRSGRGRLRADATLRPAKAPRGLVLSTGEDVPGSQSVRARMLVADVRKGDVHLKKLGAAQEIAAAGTYAEATAGFVRWLAPQLDGARKRLREGVTAWRQRALAHARYADSIGQLSASINLFLMFAIEVGAISPDQKIILERRVEVALLEVAATQAAYQRAADPVTRFLELLAACFVSGVAHLCNADDEAEPPEEAARWGWRVKRGPTRDRMGERHVGDGWELPPGSRRIGWVRSGFVYLEPAASFAEVQRLARDHGTPLAIGIETLWNRMKERKLLSHQKGRNTSQPRIGVDRRRVNTIQFGTELLSHTSAATAAGVAEGIQDDADGDSGITTGSIEASRGAAKGAAEECAGAGPTPSGSTGSGGSVPGGGGSDPKGTVGVAPDDDPDGEEII